VKEISPARNVFIGRRHEIAVLESALEDALVPRTRIVLVSGEPGVGKTRLVEEFASASRRAAARFHWGRCYEGEGAPALWPWVQVLRSLTTTARSLRPADAEGGDVDLAQILSHPSREAGISSTVFDSPDVRFRLFDRIARQLAGVAEGSPLVLIFEDLHCADSASLLLLEFVAQTLREHPVLLIGTYRDSADTRSHLGTALAEITRIPTVQRLAIKNFSAADVAAYIEEQTGVVPSVPLVNRLWERTEGNALFVAEFVRLLLDEGARWQSETPESHLPMPERVRSVIVRRLAALSPDCRGLLMAAATIGREFPLPVLGSALGVGDAEPEGLSEACRAGVIASVPALEAHARFSHALVRDVVYEDISGPQRQQLHRAVAAAMESLPERDEHLAELALHFSRAGDRDSRNKALHYARMAAEQAAQRTAYDEAARLYASALGLDDESRPREPSRRCELLLGLGAVQQAVSDRAAARATFQHAAELARDLTASGHAAGADWLARAAIGFAGGWAGIGEVGRFQQGERAAVFDAEAVNLLEEALTALGDRESALRACVLAQLAVQRHFIASRDERAAVSRQAVELARRTGDPATLGYVRCVDWVVSWGPDNSQERLAAADEIIACAERAGDRSLAIGGRFQRIAALLELGEAEALRRESALVARQAATLRQPQWLWRARAHDIAVDLFEGRFDEARELLRAARREPLHDDSSAQLFFALQTTALQRERGERARLEAAAAFLKGAVDQYPTVPSLRTRLAYLYAEIGQLEAAAHELAYIAAREFSDFPRDLTWLNAMAEAAEVCAAVADRQRASLLYELVLPFAQRHVVFLGGALSWGSVARLLGLLATTLGRWQEAAAHFEAALTANRRLGARVWVAHTQCAYGAMLAQQASDPLLARYCLEQAAFTAQVLGMRPLAERASRLLQALPTEPIAAAAPGPRATAGSESDKTPSALFYREGDFWTIGSAEALVRLRATKGLHLLDRLLRSPGQEFHVLDLALDTGARSGDAEEGPRAALEGDAGELLDAKAKAAYRERLADLRGELAAAEADNDQGRCLRLREEMESLMAELSAAVGLGGRDRRTGAAAERARMAVTKRIHDVLKKLQAEHPALGGHLRRHVKTGYFCAYLPDPERPLTWKFSPP
jgi:hypothetical protein